MLEAIIHPLPTLTSTLHSIPIPTPGPDEVLIEVFAAGSNPKDWSHPTDLNLQINSGDDIAGTVSSLGSSVLASGRFAIGDRVAAFHRMGTPGGAYAEYAIAPAHTTFHIPDSVPFEEAATIPLVSITAALTLFRRQGLPPPWAPVPARSESTPLIVYGASSALGLFTIKLALLSNIHPIIAIGGGSSAQALPLLDKKRGDAFIDYRNGLNSMTTAVQDALKGLKARHAIDAVSSNGTWIPLSLMLDPSGGSIVSVVSGSNKYDEAEIAAGVEVVYTYVGTAHDGKYPVRMPKQPKDAAEVEKDVEFAGEFFSYLETALAEGRFSGHPFEVTPGGLAGVEVSLRALQDGKARGRKFVARIADTPGLESDK